MKKEVPRGSNSCNLSFGNLEKISRNSCRMDSENICGIATLFFFPISFSRILGIRRKSSRGYSNSILITNKIFSLTINFRNFMDRSLNHSQIQAMCESHFCSLGRLGIGVLQKSENSIQGSIWKTSVNLGNWGNSDVCFTKVFELILLPGFCPRDSGLEF